MCGIVCVYHDKPMSTDLKKGLLSSISSRGPDATNGIDVDDMIWMGSSILHIQGDVIALQPLEDNDGNMILWNGEVFDGLSNDNDNDNDISDTLLVSMSLNTIVNSIPSSSSSSSSSNDYQELVSIEISKLLMRVHGPYSFVYYHKLSNTIYYGRDPFGRRSLLASLPNNDNSSSFALISVLPNKLSNDTASEFASVMGVDVDSDSRWMEVSVDGIYYISCDSINKDYRQSPTLTPWPISRVRLSRSLSLSSLSSSSSSSCSVTNRSNDDKSTLFLKKIQKALDIRVKAMRSIKTPAGEEQVSPIGVLFSGGIDSILLAAILHLSIDIKYCIDLMNVSFVDKADDSYGCCCGVGKLSPDRLAAITSLRELQRLYPDRLWRLVHIDVSKDERINHEAHIKTLIYPSNTIMDLNIGTAFWFAARGKGYLRNYDENEINEMFGVNNDGRPLVRIGGTGAALSVGLKTWSDNKCKGNGPSPCVNEGCKRVSNASCIRLFCKTCCNVLEKRSKHDSNLTKCSIHQKKKKTSQDDDAKDAIVDTIDDATVEEQNEPKDDDKKKDIKPYSSATKVLIIGIGADEQMAGYGRHRTVYKNGGIHELEKELNLDMERIWKRNLGRDDRCISDHGREAWFPYLDEDVVSFLQSLSLNEIVNFDEPPGIGDKKILRCASKLLGLKDCTEYVKRAIQFGTNIAKQTNIATKGSNRKGKGTDSLDDF